MSVHDLETWSNISIQLGTRLWSPRDCKFIICCTFSYHLSFIGEISGSLTVFTSVSLALCGAEQVVYSGFIRAFVLKATACNFWK